MQFVDDRNVSRSESLQMKIETGIKIDDLNQEKLKAVIESPNDDFLSLVQVAKLDKRNDFVGASFDRMKLDGLELKGFDFEGADFRKCSLKGTTFSECNLKGAAFSFPPEVRNRWHRKSNYFLGEENTDALELMRTASEASQKEQRKSAIIELLEIPDDGSIASFLQKISLDDKARSLRRWLKIRLTDSFKKKAAYKTLLERSLFESGEDLNEDISAYIQLMEGSDEAVETLCQACSLNPRAIKQTALEFPQKQSVQRLLIKNVSFSTSREAWIESAIALRDVAMNTDEKEMALKMRLLRVEDRYDLSRLASAAAHNNIKLSKLFELCQKGYLEEIDAWNADDFLLYCYFYDPDKYKNDVLYYSFYVQEPTESFREQVSDSTAFAAYCFLHQRELYRAIEDSRSYFYVTPRTLLDMEKNYYRESLSSDLKNQLKQLAKDAYEQSLSVRPENLVRPLAFSKIANQPISEN
jgi:hypothetical protein